MGPPRTGRAGAALVDSILRFERPRIRQPAEGVNARSGGAWRSRDRPIGGLVGVAGASAAVVPPASFLRLPRSQVGRLAWSLGSGEPAGRPLVRPASPFEPVASSDVVARLLVTGIPDDHSHTR